MNQNDMDRRFWRTGHRWSGDSRPVNDHFPATQSGARTIVLVCVVFIMTLVALGLLR
jgi:hypothetical protein